MSICGKENGEMMRIVEKLQGFSSPFRDNFRENYKRKSKKSKFFFRVKSFGEFKKFYKVVLSSGIRVVDRFSISISNIFERLMIRD